MRLKFHENLHTIALHRSTELAAHPIIEGSLMTTFPSRKDVLDQLATSSLDGHFGLFVGSGFTRALCDDAPNFHQLLEKIAKRTKLPYKFDDPKTALNLIGLSCSQIATRFKREYEASLARNPPAPADPAPSFKQHVAHICDLHPDPTRVLPFRDVLQRLVPAWAVTTNYDFAVESVVSGSRSLLPSDVLTPRADQLPVYHLHGHRRAPESIVITEEDYVSLMGPLEYRQLKMALLLSESATLMLGYSLGDINVRSAMSWSKAFEEAPRNHLRRRPFEGLLVQANYTLAPRASPYRGTDNVLVIDTTDILELLDEIADARERIVTERERRQANDQAWLEDAKHLNLRNDDFRKKFVRIVGRSGYARPFEIIDFLTKAFNEMWAMARTDGQFHEYANCLRPLLDTIIETPLPSLHPALLANIADRLEDVMGHTMPDGDFSPGKSLAASKLWVERRVDIPADTLGELRVYARENWKTRLCLHLESF